MQATNFDEAIIRSQQHRGTELGGAVKIVNEKIKHDRIIVITDEQSRTPVKNPITDKAYMINVASYQNGVGYGAWNHIDGWSESVIDYILEFEK